MAHQGLQIIQERVGYVDLGSRFPQCSEVTHVHGRLQRSEDLAPVTALQQFAFRILAWVTEFDAHEEAVQLGFRQREGAHLVQGILGGDDEERLRQGARLAIHRHLSFLHGFQECALGLRGSTVHFVREDQLREDRTRMEPEGLGLPLEDGCADDVRRQ